MRQGVAEQQASKETASAIQVDLVRGIHDPTLSRDNDGCGAQRGELGVSVLGPHFAGGYDRVLRKSRDCCGGT